MRIFPRSELWLIHHNCFWGTCSLILWIFVLLLLRAYFSSVWDQRIKRQIERKVVGSWNMKYLEVKHPLLAAFQVILFFLKKSPFKVHFTYPWHFITNWSCTIISFTSVSVIMIRIIFFTTFFFTVRVRIAWWRSRYFWFPSLGPSSTSRILKGTFALCFFLSYAFSHLLLFFWKDYKFNANFTSWILSYLANCKPRSHQWEHSAEISTQL